MTHKLLSVEVKYLYIQFKLPQIRQPSPITGTFQSLAPLTYLPTSTNEQPPEAHRDQQVPIQQNGNPSSNNNHPPHNVQPVRPLLATMPPYPLPPPQSLHNPRQQSDTYRHQSHTATAGLHERARDHGWVQGGKGSEVRGREAPAEDWRCGQ